MKKRQNKKLLIRAISELNNQLCKDLELPEITREDVLKTYHLIKYNEKDVRKTLADYKKYIINNY